MPEGIRVTVRITAQLPLSDKATPIAKQVLDRILDSDDTPRLAGIEMIDHGGERGGSSAAGRPGHQNKPGRLHHQFFADLGQAELTDIGNGRAEPAHDDGQGATLAGDVDAKAAHAAQAIGEIELLFSLKVRPLLFIGHLLEQPLQVIRAQGLVLLTRHQLAIDAQYGRAACLEVHVRSFRLGAQGHQVPHVNHRRRLDEWFLFRLLAILVHVSLPPGADRS